MIRKILVANRGEIACRILQTCKKLGIHSVAVYSDIDRNARHVQLADEAYYLGGNSAKQSYLNIEKILSIAIRAKAQAIHPGYGFLSENSAFAKACEDAGVIFIGPKSDVIEAMGNKDRAKSLMQNAQVPIIPGYHGNDQTLNRLLEEAKTLLPVMIKARAGGGGKGMRIVHNLEDVLDSLEAAKRESSKSFHDEALILEKYLPHARHIEVQVFGDNYGNYVHLFERDCSLQRRHQKIIEEAPALSIAQEIKEALYQTALTGCKAIQYTNAGTFEFLFTPEDNKFYFLEMNTRLQVEHPVTEMITSLDLVEWQILVANNEPLPLKQEEIVCFGHAIEARIYAEEALNNFLPATGIVKALILPSDRDVRLEVGVQQKDKIDIHYDPILAKVIAYEKDRKKAIQKLSGALQQTEIIGVTNNLPFLRTILENPGFLENTINTDYVAKHLPQLLSSLTQRACALLPAALLAYLLQQKNLAEQAKTTVEDFSSPWLTLSAWQLNSAFLQEIKLYCANTTIFAQVQHLQDKSFFITLPHFDPISIKGKLENSTLIYELNAQRRMAHVHFYDNYLHIFESGVSELYWQPVEVSVVEESLENKLTAPMPGIITNIWVKPGTNVQKGDKLLSIEAMKMEHTLSANKPGIIKAIYYNIGDQVDQGTKLFEFETQDAQ